MENNTSKERKNNNLSREELINLDKDVLIEKVIKLQAHNLQLKNVIRKNFSEGEKCVTNSRKKTQRPFDFSTCHYRRVLLQIVYFGWDYQGLAEQEDSNDTIEHHLFHALTKSCLIESRQTSNYHRSGRTDKGVSAFGQVISISLRSKFPVDQQFTAEAIKKELPYCKTLNRLLPDDILVVAWIPIPEDNLELSARFDCKKRQYKYYFPRSSLNIHNMRVAAKSLVGSQDFRNLCKMDVGNGVVEFRRNLLKAEILAVDATDIEKPTSMYYLLIEGNAFLWHQIRCIMGVLLLVGEGRESPNVIEELLDVDNNPRKPQYSMALDVPLNLFQCTYELCGDWVYDKQELNYVISKLQQKWTLCTIQSTMMKDVINQLEGQYASMCASEKTDSNVTESEQDRVIAYTDCLLEGIKPKVYKKLMERDTCSSLEERIDHYAKRRKFTKPEESNDQTE